VRFQGSVAVVTGAAGGIGRAVSVGLAREGASLVLCGRTLETLEGTGRDCRAAGARALVAPLDVRDGSALAGAFDRAARELGPVTVAVACHGVNELRRIEEMDLRTWEDIVSVNLGGVFLFVREAVRSMKKTGDGRIVIVSSVSGRPGYPKFPGFGAYAASKYGLAGLLEVLALELAGGSIRASMICPAGVDTEMFRRTFPGATASVAVERIVAAVLDVSDPLTAPPSGTVLDLV
jgi:NAD(P)-dependent dehydrogenase (short-subunit alcohol dehydrogenase family)